MKFNGKRFRKIMRDRDMTVEEVSFKTGLHPKSIEFILDSGHASIDAIKRLAATIGMPIEELLVADEGNGVENIIEFITGSETATATLSQRRYQSRIKKLAASHPEECQVISENGGKVICARVPVAWIKINPRRNLSNRQRKVHIGRTK